MEHIFETFVSGLCTFEWRDTCDLLHPELNNLKLPFYEYPFNKWLRKKETVALNLKLMLAQATLSIF